jgi:hypothetical protein
MYIRKGRDGWYDRDEGGRRDVEGWPCGPRESANGERGGKKGAWWKRCDVVRMKKEMEERAKRREERSRSGVRIRRRRRR